MEKRSLGRGLAAAALVALAPSLAGQWQPGDVFREYSWRPRSKFQRVTGPDATHAGAKQFLPNPVNTIRIDDLDRAVRVEVQLERLTSHAGTIRPRMRVNKNAWIDIPEAKGVPGSRGSGPTSIFLCMNYPIVRVPLAQLRNGNNTFEFTCQGRGGKLIGRLWPQWLLNGAVFRIYYDGQKARPSGAIKSPAPFARLGGNPVFEATASSSRGIRRVDFVGDYYDWAWTGEETTGHWQFHYRHGQMQRHVGTATKAPYRARWDTTWVPTQPRPFRLVARIVDSSGLTWITPAVGGLRLERSKTVVRYRNTKVPQQWQTQKYSPRKECETSFTGDLGKAEAARLFLTTWNGYEAMQIGMNGKSLRRSIGKNHDLDYNWFDISRSNIRQGRNTFYTYSTTTHHGIEVQWPGIELFVRFDVPEVWSAVDLYGTGCRGTGGVPALLHSGAAMPGRAFATHGVYRPWTPVTLITGASATQWGPFRLPLSLAGMGAPGCTLYTSLDAYAATLSNQIGLASFPFLIPNDRKLIGVRFYNQSAWLDVAANRLGYVFSNALRVSVADK